MFRNRFPKRFSETTTTNESGYPEYARPNNDRTTTVRNVQLGNNWVVPYNKYLSTKYDCHINVEICSTVKAVKYLYKYVYKGHDKAIIELKENQPEKFKSIEHDEVKRYIYSRYVSDCEAFWRIFGFSLHEEFPNVYRLAVHLEGEESLIWNEDEVPNLEQLAKRPPASTLTKWFSYNRYIYLNINKAFSFQYRLLILWMVKRNNEDGRHLLYSEFPRWYTWNKSERTWKKRCRGETGTIGRIYNVSPKEGERYYLRILLNHVPGCQSFNDLKTVDGRLAHSFKHACQLRGLIEDDKASDDCLGEAVTYQMPKSLRKLFAILLITNEVKNI